MPKRRRVKDKWRSKKWYKVVTPSYFGSVEIGSIPTDDPDKLLGKIIESTLYDVTEDFAHQYFKMYFKITRVNEKVATTVFRGHEYSRDYLRSLVRRRTTRIDRVFEVETKDKYRLRIFSCAFTLKRARASQMKQIRDIMKLIVDEKANSLTYNQFVQEAVLGKVASDIYNEAKKIVPQRHVGIRKTKLLYQPSTTYEEPAPLVTKDAGSP